MEIHHKAKKSLGQNFLTSPQIVASIVASGGVTSVDVVLEIGPGKGVLTKNLLETGATVYAVEKDDALYMHLAEVFSSYIDSGKLHLLRGDILELEKSLVLPDSYKLIANIPYNITGKIISTFLSRENKPTTMVLMVQYEVARRITSNEKSILSLSVEAYGKASFEKKVLAGSFFPKPRVDSAVLMISSISNRLFIENNVAESTFFDVLHAGFAHKRKKVLSNLRERYPQVLWKDIFTRLAIDENTRAEELDLTTWFLFTREIVA